MDSVWIRNAALGFSCTPRYAVSEKLKQLSPLPGERYRNWQLLVYSLWSDSWFIGMNCALVFWPMHPFTVHTSVTQFTACRHTGAIAFFPGERFRIPRIPTFTEQFRTISHKW